MNVIIYGRVSTENQDYSRQVRELERYCLAHEWNIVEVFTEKISGTKSSSQRGEMNRLLQLIDNNNSIQGVLVTELSRIGRDTADVLKTIGVLTEKKIWLYSKRENITTLREDGTKDTNASLTLTILSGIAEHEKELIVHRTVSGLKHNVEYLKRWTGGVFLPYGYRREEKKLVVEETEAEVVKLIFKLYLDGLGTKKIAEKLNQLKVPTRYNLSLQKDQLTIRKRTLKKEDFVWRDGTIYGILTNEVYVGTKKGSKNLKGITLFSPPIIEKETFERVQTGLKSKQIKRETKFTYYFQNKLFCGKCGRTYFPHQRTPKEPNKVSSDNRYICLSKRYQECCGNYGIGIPKLRDGIWSVLRHNKKEIENILNLNSENLVSIEDQIAQLINEINTLENEKKTINNEERRHVDLYIKNLMSEVVYQGIYKELNTRREKIEKSLETLRDELNRKTTFKEKQANVNVRIRNIKENSGIFKRTIDNVINRIVIYPVVEHNLKNYIKINSQDKFLFIEIYTYINEITPLVFVISQRGDDIITPKIGEYTKDGKLEIGKRNNQQSEEEEEEEGMVFSVRKLHKLSLL
jgi:site-specific DNA recombinase